MKLYSSLWEADDWATQGGLVKTDWSKAPFTAYYRNYNVDTARGGKWWTHDLDANSRRKMRRIQKKNMIYNYCQDAKRFPEGYPTECKHYKFQKNIQCDFLFIVFIGAFLCSNKLNFDCHIKKLLILLLSHINCKISISKPSILEFWAQNHFSFIAIYCARAMPPIRKIFIYSYFFKMITLNTFQSSS